MGAGRPKQYLPLQNQSVIFHTLSRLAQLPGLKAILVGISADDPYWSSLRELTHALPCPVIKYEGGVSRAETVPNAL